MKYADKTPEQKRRAYLYLKAWRSRNKDRALAESRASLRLRRSHQYRRAWPLIVEHYGGKCLSCGSAETCFDHVAPLHCGGENQLTNGQPLCVKCNTIKGKLAENSKDWRPDKGEWIVALMAANPWLVIPKAGKRWGALLKGQRIAMTRAKDEAMTAAVRMP